MKFLFRGLMSQHHTRAAKRQFKRGRVALCLYHLNQLAKWDSAQLEQPKLFAYLTLCHFQLRHWSNITTEVERALFLLRRFIQKDKEAFVLWQELKSHLAELQHIEKSKPSFVRAGNC